MRPANSDYTRKRSRSPYRTNHQSPATKRHRSRSPRRPRSHHDHAKPSTQAELPYHARPLHKRDLKTYRALFAEYLDVQKGKDIEDLGEDEVKGRWKSFVGKWNRGELAEGWYEADTKRRADERAAERLAVDVRPALPKGRDEDERVVDVKYRANDGDGREGGEDEEDEDEDYGPIPLSSTTASNRAGPTIPTLSDLQDRRETTSSSPSHPTLGQERKAHLKLQNEHLNELAPRAEPGSRERQLEKKRETASSNLAFSTRNEAGDQEIGDGELMGGGEEELKQLKKREEKKKTEREVRKEEVLRARQAEREERLGVLRGKEEETMRMLRGLAEARFG